MKNHTIETIRCSGNVWEVIDWLGDRFKLIRSEVRDCFPQLTDQEVDFVMAWDRVCERERRTICTVINYS